ncbi:MFS transporter [Rhodospira trueperi]|uniref:Predicted arabinose efflux permease, MFS family n=1 Tax=Rhodospira trueperi TaxID=69960 RepID=A0A1G7ASP6_9PROT|nr:MFS transporter [Rhodospira trueperi]SDE17811.1 Predicted arabinose efflux permease, MFS family [Rhodospira trueperi]
MTPVQARTALGFSCVGHSISHVFEPIFYVVALVLPTVFDISYEVALSLILAGKLLFGIAAPFAGWLGDRWSSTGMMAAYFLGIGASAMWAGLAGGPLEMAVALGFLGLFGSIYHPVGIAWLVRNAVNRGKALGVNGAFGGFGPAIGGLMAGVLIDALGWRSAFLIPGALTLVIGFVFLWLVWRGVIIETKTDARSDPPPDKRDTARVYVIIAMTMLVGGIIYQATQASMPKVFDERLGGLFGEGASGVGVAVMVVYGIAGLFQIITGHLADRYPLKVVYVSMYILQAPFLALAATATGLPLLMVMLMMVSFNIGALPAENSLLAKYTPPSWRSTAYGMKFVLAFGISGLAVPLVAWIRATTGDFAVLYLLLAVLATLVIFVGSRLPRERPAPAAEPAPAE